MTLPSWSDSLSEAFSEAGLCGELVVQYSYSFGGSYVADTPAWLVDNGDGTLTFSAADMTDDASDDWWTMSFVVYMADWPSL